MELNDLNKLFIAFAEDYTICDTGEEAMALWATRPTLTMLAIRGEGHPQLLIHKMRVPLSSEALQWEDENGETQYAVKWEGIWLLSTDPSWDVRRNVRLLAQYLTFPRGEMHTGASHKLPSYASKYPDPPRFTVNPADRWPKFVRSWTEQSGYGDEWICEVRPVE